MKARAKSTGYRQAAWDRLRKKPSESVSDLAAAIGCSADGLRAYIAALEIRGYVARANTGHISLAKNSGPRAPAWSVHTNDFRDWNIDKPMSGAALKKIVTRSGLSETDFLRACGFHEAGSTRLRQMINGQRPVSSDIEAAARTLAAKSPTG